MSNRWRLTIVEGVHAGGTHELAEGSYLIGSDFDGDIVLLDEDVAARHLRLDVGAGGTRLAACDDASFLVNGAVPGDKQVVLTVDDVVRCGAAAFRVEPLDAQHPMPAPSDESAGDSNAAANRRIAHSAGGRRWPVAVPVLAVSIAFGAVIWQLFDTPKTPPQGIKAALLATGRNAASASTDSAHDAAPPAARDEIVHRIREFIGEDNLTVERGEQGEVIVSGITHAKGAREQLQRIQTEYAGTVEIKDEISYVSIDAPRQVQLPQRITDVHVGEMRWFRTADGGRYFEGSQLEDGAEVVRIGLDAIVFRHHGRLTEFRPTN